MAGRVLVTGASGFVGGAVVRRLLQDGRDVRAAVRREPEAVPTACTSVIVGDIDGSTRWSHAVGDIATVVHCAARVHRLADNAADPLADFRATNRDGTANLARQAAAAGVARFVFVSSIKVNGEASAPGRPFRADDRPEPRDPYGVSKHEAEQALAEIGSASGMEVVVIRPPLVYGPGVKANFRTMLGWLQRGLPLPFGAIHNQRSLVALENLADLVAACTTHRAAAGRTFLVSDGEDLSTPELLRRAATALGRPARLLPVPAGWIRAAAALAGRPGLADRLCGSLQVDIAATRAALGWRPPVCIDDALVGTAQHFLAASAGMRWPRGDNRRR